MSSLKSLITCEYQPKSLPLLIKLSYFDDISLCESSGGRSPTEDSQRGGRKLPLAKQ
jgi:hypothetical protein